jgi:hypothetical protein
VPIRGWGSFPYDQQSRVEGKEATDGAGPSTKRVVDKKESPTCGSFLLARFRGHEFPGRDLPEGAHLEGLRRAC